VQQNNKISNSMTERFFHMEYLISSTKMNNMTLRLIDKKKKIQKAFVEYLYAKDRSTIRYCNLNERSKSIIAMKILERIT
jgi:hypothetical protein